MSCTVKERPGARCLGARQDGNSASLYWPFDMTRTSNWHGISAADAPRNFANGIKTIMFSFAISTLAHGAVLSLLVASGWLEIPQGIDNPTVPTLTLVAVTLPEDSISVRDVPPSEISLPALPLARTQGGPRSVLKRRTESPPLDRVLEPASHPLPREPEAVNPMVAVGSQRRFDAIAAPAIASTVSTTEDTSAKFRTGMIVEVAQKASPTIPRYRRNPSPVYPSAARARGQEGTVLLEVMVSVYGRPDAIQVKRSSGYAALDKAAIKAVRKWEFEPARAGGEAVESSIEVPIVFQIQR